MLFLAGKKMLCIAIMFNWKYGKDIFLTFRALIEALITKSINID